MLSLAILDWYRIYLVCWGEYNDTPCGSLVQKLASWCDVCCPTPTSLCLIPVVNLYCYLIRLKYFEYMCFSCIGCWFPPQIYIYNHILPRLVWVVFLTLVAGFVCFISLVHNPNIMLTSSLKYQRIVYYIGWLAYNNSRALPHLLHMRPCIPAPSQFPSIPPITIYHYTSSM